MCGIVGWVGNKPADIDKIKILGMYNTTRGTDSCGIVINNEVKKGVGTLSNFTNFMEKTKLSTSVDDENYTILLHTRAASNKTTTSDASNAHPFEIKETLGLSKNKIKKLKKKGESVEEPDTVLIGVHNGIIRNDSELAKEYSVTNHIVDSHIILSILAKAKDDNALYKVLEEYEGDAVLAWFYPDEPNTLYLWKGAKFDYKNELEEERPLFIYNVDDGYYISSIKDSLYGIGGNETNVFPVQSNCVIKIKAGEKFRIRPIKRNVKVSSYYNDYGLSNNSRYVSSVNKAYSPIITTPDIPSGGKERTEFFRKKMVEVFEGYPVSKITTEPLIGSSKKHPILLDNEPFTHNTKLLGDKVYFYKGRYWKNGHMLKGYSHEEYLEIELDVYGYSRSSTKRSTEDDELETFYFYEGLLLKSKEDAEALIECYKNSATSVFNNESIGEFNLYNVRPYVYGFVSNFNDKNGTTRDSKTTNIYSNYWATGEYSPMFDYDKTYTFDNGVFVKATFSKVDLKDIMTIIKKFDEPKKETKIISLPITTGPINNGEETDDDNIYNLCGDVMTASKEAIKAIDVTGNSRYAKLKSVLKVTSSAVKSRLDNLDIEVIREDSEARGILYS